MSRYLLPSTRLPTSVEPEVRRPFIFDMPATEAPPPVRGGGKPSRDMPHLLVFAEGPANTSGVDQTPWGDDVANVQRIPPSLPDAMAPTLYAVQPTGTRCVPEPWDDPYVLGDDDHA